jgi:hypothetical protein
VKRIPSGNSETTPELTTLIVSADWADTARVPTTTPTATTVAATAITEKNITNLATNMGFSVFDK